MAKKRVPRKELLKTEDEFITFSARLLQNIIKYKMQVSCAVGGILLLVVIYTGMQYYSNQKENQSCRTKHLPTPASYGRNAIGHKYPAYAPR